MTELGETIGGGQQISELEDAVITFIKPDVASIKEDINQIRMTLQNFYRI